jgi:hypothetical protein
VSSNLIARSNLDQYGRNAPHGARSAFAADRCRPSNTIEPTQAGTPACVGSIVGVMAAPYCRMRHPVRKIHHTAARHSPVKTAIAARLTATGTSAVSKKAQRKTDIR